MTPKNKSPLKKAPSSRYQKYFSSERIIQSRTLYFLISGLFLFTIFCLVQNLPIFEYHFSPSDFVASSLYSPSSDTTTSSSLETTPLIEIPPSEVEVRIPTSTGSLETNAQKVSSLITSPSLSSVFSSTEQTTSPSSFKGLMEMAKSNEKNPLPSLPGGTSPPINRITGEQKVSIGNRSIPFPKGGRALYGDMYLRNPALLSGGVSRVIRQILGGVEIRYSYLKMIRDPSFNRAFIEAGGLQGANDQGYEMDEGYRYEVRGPRLDAFKRQPHPDAPCLLFGQAALRLMTEKKIDLIIHIGKFGMVREDGPFGEYDGYGATPIFEMARKEKIPIFVFLTDGKGMKNFSEIVSSENPWGPPRSFVDSIRSTGGDVIDITGRSWHQNLDRLLNQAPSEEKRLQIRQHYCFYLDDADQHQWWIQQGF
ncbi:MAG: hypothetical protein V4507_02335 [Verrucomicrobiota bacterium]